MRPSSLVLAALPTLLLSSAALASDECVVDFKSLLAWRMKASLTATESKFLNRPDCLREVGREEFLKPELSPRCAHLPYRGSSVEKEEALPEAFDARDLFSQYAKKKGKSAWLGNLYQALFERSSAFAKKHCEEREFKRGD